MHWDVDYKAVAGGRHGNTSNFMAKRALPQQVLEDSNWMRVVHFFLIESPCPGQSNRNNNEIDKWAPAPWVGIRSLKTSLNQAIFSRRDVDAMLAVRSKKELEGTCK